MRKKDNISSIYIHIPFCKNICSYCDFCKFYYNENLVNKYLNSLEAEIKDKYNNEIIETIYIGGGTPSMLTIKELERLFSILKCIKTSNNLEFTIECNVEDISLDKLLLFKENKINRLSIGVQSFQDRILLYLDRKYNKDLIINNINLAKKYFNNINVDLIYAVIDENISELKNDLELFISLNVPHISTYSLIIENNTKLKINKIDYIDEEIDRKMYDLICNKLKENDYIHYEISNFSKSGYESKHNLTYWKNQKYYGFGLGASGYIENYRYTNTKNINKYLNSEYLYEKELITNELDASNYAMLGLRTIYGVDKNKFKELFGIDFIEYFKVKQLILDNILLENNSSYYINPDYWYVLNEILIKFI